jgi:hypothetical protein
MFDILFLFLHSRSPCRTDMPEYLLFYLFIVPLVGAFAAHAQA